MDISRRDFGKWMGALGMGAMSTSALDLGLPSTVGAATIITPTNVDISRSLDYNGWYDPSKPANDDHIQKKWVGTAWEITIKTKNQEMVFEANDILWCEDHDSSINESQVKIYKNALDLTILVNEQGKRIMNHICKNHTYRIIAKKIQLTSYKGST